MLMSPIFSKCFAKGDFMNKDLTVGKPSTVLWKFCLPLFGSVIFQQLYNIADSLVAGKFIGNDALAAVGNSYEITLIFIAFAFGCNVGCSVVVSRLFGAKKLSDMKTAVYTTLIASAFLCGALMILGFVFCEGLMELINTPESLMSDSLIYLRIYIAGLPFFFYYNVSTGIFSALGDSKTPFFFLAASSTSNILVDILFVTVFKMGVAGVALATFICQGISCVLALIFVLRRLSAIKTEEKAAIFSAEILKSIAVIAIPSILQQSFISVGNIIIQSTINGFGTDVMAGYSGAIKLNNLVITSLTTISNGMSNFTAQNMGAGKLSRIDEGFRASLKMVYIICTPFVLFYFFFGNLGLLLFMNDSSGDAMQVGVAFLRIVSPFYFVIATKQMADSTLRGTGLMGRFMVSTFTDLSLRVILAIVLSSLMSSSAGIWLSWPIGWIVSTAMSLVFYFAAPWRRKMKNDKSEIKV